MVHDNTCKNNTILIIVGPSGSGKTTINKRLVLDYPNIFENSISYTSRSIRAGEKDGINYYFISNEEFDQMQINGEFVEHTNYVGFQYGTPSSELDRIINLGKVPVLEIDVKGFNQLVKSGYKTKSVFIMPADLETLRKRLTERGRDSEESIKRRLERAAQEISESQKCPFDFILPNDNLDTAYSKFVDTLKQWFPSMNDK